MLGSKRVLVVSGDAEGGRHLVEAIELVGGRIVGRSVDGAEALPLVVRTRPDAVVVDFAGGGPGMLALLDELLASGTPVVICAEPGHLPEFRGRHPTVSVLPVPVRPMRVVGEIAVLLRL
jgi:chemotaxis response regulator CheB